MKSHVPDLEIEKVWNEFWRDIVMPDGVLDLEQVKKELYDWRNAMREVSKVYDEITGGLLSKPNYEAETVLSVYRDRQREEFEDWLKENGHLKEGL